MKPKQTNVSQPTTTGWGSLEPHTQAMLEEIREEAIEADDELMPIHVAVNEMAKDLRDLREMFEALMIRWTVI